MNQVTKALDNGYCAVGIFSDFSKAFDTAIQSMSIEKSYDCDVRGNARECFRSYLPDKSQYASYNGVLSSNIINQLTWNVWNVFARVIYGIAFICPKTVEFILQSETLSLYHIDADLTSLFHTFKVTARSTYLSEIDWFENVVKLSVFWCVYFGSFRQCISNQIDRYVIGWIQILGTINSLIDQSLI